MALDKTYNNYGYLVGRAVALIENTTLGGIPHPYSSLVADDISKLTYWLTEALKQDNASPDLIDVADRILKDPKPYKPLRGDDLNRYWVGYYHQQADITRRQSRKLIGEQLKNARLAAGLTIHDLEEQTSIDSSQISRIEAGRSNASIDTITTLARHLNIPNIDIF